MNFILSSNRRPRLGLLDVLVCLTAIFTFVGSVKGQDLPAGREKETVETTCTVCHTTDRILASARSRQEWQDLVHRMIGHGAELPDNKVDTVVAYLAQNFPPPAGAAGAAPKAPDGKPDLSGVWVAGGGGATRTRPEMALTPWGDAQYLWNTEPVGHTGFVEPFERQRIELDPIFNCYPAGLLRLGPPSDTDTGAGGGGVEILQTPGVIVMIFEQRNSVRNIYTDGRGHPKNLERTWNGHSIGKWEGDTLVVDTVGLRDESWVDSDGHEHSTQLHVVERYRRLDGGSLEVERTLTDPVAFAKPSTSKTVLKLNPKYDLNENRNTNDCTNYMVRKPAFGKGMGGLLGISDHP